MGVITATPNTPQSETNPADPPHEAALVLVKPLTPFKKFLVRHPCVPSSWLPLEISFAQRFDCL